MTVPFVGGSYPLKRKKADTQRTVNLYVANVESGQGKSKQFLKSIPGLTEFSPVPIVPVPDGFNPDPSVFDSARWVLSVGNTRATVPPGSGTLTHTRSINGRADKRYFEAVTSANNGLGEDALVGLMNQYFPYSTRLGDLYINAGGEGVDPLAHSCSYNISGQVQKDAVLLDTIDAYAVDTVVMIAFDGVTGHVWFGNNGVWDGSPGAGTGWNVALTAGGTYYVGVGLDNNGSASNLVDWQGHFITDDLTYPAPAGFLGWDD